MSGDKSKLQERIQELERMNSDLREEAKSASAIITTLNISLREAKDLVPEKWLKKLEENDGGISTEDMELLKLEKEKIEKQLQINDLIEKLAVLGHPVAPTPIKEEQVNNEDGVQLKGGKMDFSWVLPCEGKFGYRRFANTFETLAKTALRFNPTVYESEFVDAALEIAFTKGKFTQGLDDLELYKKKGHSGFGLLELLRTKYNMVQSKALAIAEANFKSIRRERNERLHDVIQRFTRLQAKVEVLLPTEEPLSDRDLRHLFRKILTEQEFRDCLHECRELARDDEDMMLGGEGIDKYSFDCWLSAAEQVALMMETSYDPSKRSQARAFGVTQQHEKGYRGGKSFNGGRPPQDGEGNDNVCWVCAETGHWAAKCPLRKDRLNKAAASTESNKPNPNCNQAQQKRGGRGGRGGRGNGRGRGFGKNGQHFQKSQPSPQQ